MVEGTLFSFVEQMELQQALQDLRKMVEMFSHTQGVNEDVVDVDQDKLVEKIPEHFVFEILKYRGSIDQAIGITQCS